MDLQNFEQIIERAKTSANIRRGAVVAAEELHILEAALMAFEDGIVEPVLIGDAPRIIQGLEHFGHRADKFEVIGTDSTVESAQKAVALAKSGDVSFIAKGGIQTADLMRAVLNREEGLRTDTTVSALMTYQIPNYHKLLTITDVGVLINPDLLQKKHMIQNGVRYLRNLGIETPRVAVVAPNELVNPKMQETLDGRDLKQMNLDGEITDCIVEGPISYDISISKEVAETKGFESPVAGEADLMIFHNISVANIVGKVLENTCRATCAGVIMGARVPICAASRGSSVDDKYRSLIIAASAANL